MVSNGDGLEQARVVVSTSHVGLAFEDCLE